MNINNPEYNVQELFKWYINIFDKKLSNIPVFLEYPTHNELISEFLKSTNIKQEYEIQNVEEISMIYDYVINNEQEKLISYFNRFNYNEILDYFYYLAEYISELHVYLYVKMYKSRGMVYGNLNIDFKDFNDKLKEKVINKVIEGRIDFSLVSYYMGIDKAFIQYFFMFLDKANKNYDKGNILREKDFEYIYSCISNIIFLVADRDILINLFYKFKKIKIENYIIIFPDKLSYMGRAVVSKSFEDSIKFDTTVSKELYKILDDNFESEYGFKHKELVLFLESDICDMRDMVKVYEESDLLRKTASIIGDSNKAMKIIDFLTFKNELDCKHIQCIDFYEKRIMLTPIVTTYINNKKFYLLSYFLVYHSVFKLFEKIRYNDFKKQIGKNKKIIKDLSNKIVEDIKNELVNKCDFVDYNIEIMDEENNKSYEVDVIFILKNSLYIVECKDTSYEFDPYGFKGERRQGKKFIQNINIKQEIIRKNIQKYINKFNNNFTQINKIIVYKRYNIFEDINDGNDVTILSEHKFYEWFNNISK